MKPKPQPQIENGIPLPWPGKGSGRKRTSIVYIMEVGDSFIAPTASVRACAYATAKNLGIKITSRKLADGSARIWRTA